MCNRVDRVGSRPLPPCLYASVAQPFSVYYFQLAFDAKLDSKIIYLSIYLACS